MTAIEVGCTDCDLSYKGSKNISVKSLANYDYAISNITFGNTEISNGTKTQYYANLTEKPSDYSVLFQTNFPGLGLPTPLFSNLTTLINQLQPENLNCSVGPNFCNLQGSCKNYTSILEFSV